MARACTICSHPDRDAIDTAIRVAESHHAIAMQYGVTHDSVRRHAVSHLGETTTAKRTARANSAPNRARVQGQHIPADELNSTQQIFLDAFVVECNESAALRMAHIDRATARRWEENDTLFSLRYHEAQRQVDDRIDGEIARRALLGVPEPVVSSGKIIRNDDGSIMTVQKYSDRMLELLAKARLPKYRDKSQVELSGKDGGPIQTKETLSIDIDGLSVDELLALRDILEQAKQRETAHGSELQ